jgi:hypothetical protein
MIMIPEQKLREIVEGLFRKTREGALEWMPDPGTGTGGGYWVGFPNSRIEICKVSPPSEKDFIVMTIFGERGQEVGRWQVDEGSSPDRGDWDLVLSLYNEVDRYVLGWDVVVDEIEKLLSQPGKIKGPTPEPPQPRPQSSGREDIPF